VVIKGRDGAANGFVLEPVSASPAPTATPGDLSYLAWSPASDSGQLRSGARDAVFRLDTVEMRSATNRVSGLPEGITLDLTATNIGAPTTIGFSQNSAAIQSVMADFTAALNDVVAQLNGGEEGDTALLSDPGARELRRDLAQLTNAIVMPGAAAGEPRTLADLGLSLTREGTFRLDTARLNQTLADNPQAAAAMFTTGVRGVFATVDNLARDNTAVRDPGSLGGSVTRLQAQIERNDERLSRVAEQQAALRDRLTRDFTRTQTNIAASQSTLDFIRRQFEISGE
jgi:flagellar hook-associated protein 2